jgi:two-component system response regulator CpxR
VTLPGAIDAGATAAPAELQLGDDVLARPVLASRTRFDPPSDPEATIVLAEDDVRLAEAIAELLAARDTVHVAADGEAALELVRRHHPQLVITDVDMPRLGGIELARRFREVSGDKLAPVILLSAMVDLHTRVTGLEAGAVDYVAKPFDPRDSTARSAARARCSCKH